MRHRALLAAAVLLAAASSLAGPAAALHFQPPSTNFTGTGSLFFVPPSGPSVTCASAYTLKTNPGTGSGPPPSKLKITGLTLSGTGCSAITPTGFDWVANASSSTTTTTQFTGVTFITPAGTCGPATTPTKISGSVLSLGGQFGGCIVRDQVMVSPSVAINPP